jgi:hypothetical protein
MGLNNSARVEAGLDTHLKRFIAPLVPHCISELM